MKNLFIYSLLCLFAASCTTIDVEKSLKASSGTGKDTEARLVVVPIEAPTEPAIIEKPIYVPQSPAAPRQTTGRQAVESANREGTAQPKDYSAAAMLYDYHRDFVYEIYCQPLRITDIALKPGERAVEAPFVSDSERFMLGAAISYDNGTLVQHIYVKPTSSNIQASLIINTNERVYHIILKSFSNVHMPMVRWRYQDSSLPQRWASGAGGAVFTESDSGMLADPRFLSFNYKITRSLSGKPRWLPDMVYDDGKKTYISFPADVLQTEIPAIFENRADILNYRVSGNIMIIDKLIEKITVKIGSKSVTVTKKKG